ncbi:hypothetical protein T01_4463 [Trichinella spiralis]|uniref:Uncharacterized protein n=1 Tax=Trichinella spiralis TaxID=6334 RepID=A0A0V1B4Y1_TRISP|nr:hypothetical protein T01_4463 [Trichinella spiralis]
MPESTLFIPRAELRYKIEGTSPYSVPGAAAWVTDCSQNRESVSLNIQRVNHSCRLMIDCAKDWDGWGVSCG